MKVLIYLIPDLKKIHDSGKEILNIIEESLTRFQCKSSGDKISEIAKKWKFLSGLLLILL